MRVMELYEVYIRLSGYPPFNYPREGSFVSMLRHLGSFLPSFLAPSFEKL